MSISQIFAKLNTLDAEVSLFRDKSSWRDPNERWGCIVLLSHNGTELKIKTTAATGEDALLSALDKIEFMLSSSTLVSALNLPLIAAPQSEA